MRVGTVELGLVPGREKRFPWTRVLLIVVLFLGMRWVMWM